MLGEMKTAAALLGKMIAHDPTAMKGQTVLRMATINGAKALGLEVPLLFFSSFPSVFPFNN